MSSTLTSTEIQKLPRAKMTASSALAGPAQRTKDNHLKLVRSASIDKIRQFNTYICSQHYYILPALFAWLRSSQYALHNAAEKILKTIILNTLVLKLVQTDCRSLSYRALLEQTYYSLQNIRLAIANFYSVYSNDFESTFLKSTVYAVGAILNLQLFFCVYLLTSTAIPAGLIFLVASICYINILHYKTEAHFMNHKMADTSYRICNKNQ